MVTQAEQNKVLKSMVKDLIKDMVTIAKLASEARNDNLHETLREIAEIAESNFEMEP